MLQVAKIDHLSDTRHGANRLRWQARLQLGADASTIPTDDRQRRVRVSRVWLTLSSGRNIRHLVRLSPYEVPF